MAFDSVRFRPVKWLKSFTARLFCRRNIIIIADHKTQHIPFSVTTQLGILLSTLGVVVWVSYSTGSYMAAKRVLVEKDRTIASTTQENARIEAEFTLLRRDLMTLAQQQNAGKLANDAKMIVEQYVHSDQPVTGELKAKDAPAHVPDYNAVFARIEFLEKRVRDLQSTHDTMVDEIKLATNGKIKELQRVIAMVGLDQEKLQRKREATLRGGFLRSGEGGRGGPFEPVATPMLRQREPNLYMNLKKLMVLSDVVGHMPLAMPMPRNARKTSGFGTRVDPFTGRLAFHSGLDFSGPKGTAVRVTSDGRVVAAGWQNAYGKMVDIDHGLGFVTRYAHLSAITVKEGQRVMKGAVIGVQGSTGRSTGKHLHYEVRYEGRALNPKPFLTAGEYVQSLEE